MYPVDFAVILDGCIIKLIIILVRMANVRLFYEVTLPQCKTCAFQTTDLQCLLKMRFLASVRQNLDFVYRRSLVLTWPLFQFLVCFSFHSA